MTQDSSKPQPTDAVAPVDDASSSALSQRSQGRRQFIRTGIVVGVPLILTLSSRSAWAGHKHNPPPGGNTPPSNATALASNK